MKRHIPVQLLEVLENLFRCCNSCVKWNGVLSSVMEIKLGVRQGSVLSLFLFSLYLDDSSKLGVNIILWPGNCRFIQSHLPGGANSTKRNNSRWAPHVADFSSFCVFVGLSARTSGNRWRPLVTISVCGQNCPNCHVWNWFAFVFFSVTH